MLSKPGVLERFMPRESEKVAEIRQTFTELWSLEKSGDDCPIDVIEKAIKSPNEFVLKAQMQQGKGVYFGNEMVKKLRGLSDDELGAHILQSKIRPYTTKVCDKISSNFISNFNLKQYKMNLFLIPIKYF